MDLLSAKIVAMVLMGSLALLFGLLPLKVKLMILKGEANSRKRKKRERIISGLLCFGSGVLLATVFIHMIPETREGFQRLQKLKSSNQPKALKHNLHYNNSHNSTEDWEEHDFHDHYHDHYHHKNGENPIYHNHDHHNPSHDHENQNDTHDLDTTSENYNVTSKTNFGKNENHVHHRDHDHDNKHSNNINQPNDYHNISENADHNHVHIQDHKISMKKNHSHVHTPDHDHGHSHDHTEEGHDHVHSDNITEPNDSDNISDNADHNHVHIPDHEISEKENHTHVHSPDHDHSHNHNHNKEEHPHVHFDNVTKLNNNHNISENEDHNHIHMRDHEISENGKHKHFHVPEHDHKRNHSSKSDHDDSHFELEEDASHNSNSGSFLSTNDHISNFSNSEYENDTYNEPRSHSVNNEQNERTTLTSVSVERDSKDNSENNKSYNSHEKQFHRTDVNSSRGLDNKSELSDHSHHDLSEFGSTIHSHHENENHDEHEHGNLSLSTPNEQSNVGSILEPVTEQNHNFKNINNFMEKHKENGNKLILGKDVEKKDFDNDETIKENGPKFEALKQEANTTLSPKNNKHDEHGSTQSQHERNDHDAHEHDHNHDSQHDHEHGGEDHGYPMAELVFCLGFLLIYFIEEIVHKLLLKHSHHHHHHHHHHVHHHHHTPSEDENSIEVGSVHTRVPSLRGYEDISLKDKESAINLPSITTNNNHKWEEKVNRDARMVTQGIDNPAFAADIDASSWNPALRNSVMFESNNQVVPTRVTNGNGVVIASNGISAASVHRPESTTQQKSKTSMKGICEHLLSNVGSLLIVIALSFHSIFEGLAVGLQEVQKDVWYLFLAISAHKFVIAFCIGLEFLEAGTPLVLYLLYMVGLALITPIGVGIGIIVTENETFGGIGHYYVITVLQGLAGGTLLYVALLEVLERERIKPGGRLIKIFCLALGFGVMASLEAVGGHSHGPAEGGQH